MEEMTAHHPGAGGVAGTMSVATPKTLQLPFFTRAEQADDDPPLGLKLLQAVFSESGDERCFDKSSQYKSLARIGTCVWL